MKKHCAAGVLTLLLGTAASAQAAEGGRHDLIVTASNTTPNQLLVYDSSDNLIQVIPTQGQGGASGNAGGIAAKDGLVAVVNFGSQSVSVFRRDGNGLGLIQVIPAASNPVSVAFGDDHLYVLGTTEVESHRLSGQAADPRSDGVAALLKGDGSAAQVGVADGQLIITEKSNTVERVNLSDGGAIAGVATLVRNIPANVNTPLGLVTRGDDAYVTIAHADEISLVRDGTVLTVTGSGTQHAPCWLTLAGPFLFSSNSPSSSVSRYAVYGQKIVQDAAVAAQFSGSPTDIASGDGLVAVVDGIGTASHLSIFEMDEDGNLTLKAATTVPSPANGVAVIRGED